jgi:20S proteasome alpha/beta subunit
MLILEYQDICRFEKITEHAVVVATGEYADFQQVSHKLK